MKARDFVSDIEISPCFYCIIFIVEINGLFSENSMNVSFEYRGPLVFGQVDRIGESPRLLQGQRRQFIEPPIPIGDIRKLKEIRHEHGVGVRHRGSSVHQFLGIVGCLGP